MSIKPADMGMTLSNNSNSQEINYIMETKFRSNNVWSDTLSGEIGCLILMVAALCLSYGYKSETRRVCKEWILRCCLHRDVFFAQSRSMDRAWRLWDMVITWGWFIGCTTWRIFTVSMFRLRNILGYQDGPVLQPSGPKQFDLWAEPVEKCWK